MSGMLLTAGVDIGSITTKVVLWQEGGQWQSLVQPTGPRPRLAAGRALQEILVRAGREQGELGYIVATGYGRAQADFATRAVTEITCHARGAQELLPGTDMVIDIGGQDSKVIRSDGQGQVVDFVMNDKCAAGTGRFLEVMAGALGTRVEELARMASGAEPVEITSTCTVFAESEVIGLLARDVSPRRIVAGIHRAVAHRVAAMAQRLGLGRSICFTGGVALNQGVRAELARVLGRGIHTSPHCQLAGALGAALIAAQRLEQGS